MFPSISYLAYIRLHWWKAYDECLCQERALCIWNPGIFMSVNQIKNRRM